MGLWRLFSVLCVAVFLVGCSSSSDNIPAINIPLSMQGKNKVSSVNLPYLAWWRKFNDPSLDKLIESALNNNPSVAIAKENINIVQAQLNTIKLNWIPGVSLFAGLSQNPALGNPGVFYGLEPTYFMNFFNNYYLQKQAKYHLHVVEAQKMAVRLTVISQVAAGYFSLLAWQNNLQLLNKREDLYWQELSINKTLKRNGLTSELVIDDLYSQIHDIQSMEQEVNNNIVASNNALKYLINQSPGEIKLKNSIDNLDSMVINPGMINAKVIANRPDVMVASWQIKAANAGIDVAGSNLLPSLQLDSFNGQVGIGNGASPYGANFNDAYALFTLNPSTFGAIGERRAELKEAIVAYNAVIINALREISNTLAANKKLTSSYKLKMLAVKDWQNDYAIQHINFSNGLISKLQLLDDALKVNKLQLEANNYKLQQLISIVLLYQQLAGGYMSSESS